MAELLTKDFHIENDKTITPDTNHYRVRYSMGSVLNGYIEYYRYINSFSIEVSEENYDGKPTPLVAKAVVHILLLGEALNKHAPWIDVIDVSGQIFDIGKQVLDFDSGYFSKPIEQYYDGRTFMTDICIIERIEVVSSHRGRQIGSELIKDIIGRFSGSCAFFVLKCCPLQLEHPDLHNDKNWEKQMAFQSLEQKKGKATTSLHRYYKSLGFENIPKLPLDIMFFNPH